MASLAEVNYAAACEPGTTQLGSALGSIIKLTIKNARGLRNKEQFGMKSDPYVSLSQFSGFCMWGETTQGLDKKKCSGKWIDSNLDPDFNQEFYFVASKDTTRCKLMVMDHNAGIIADELMASAPPFLRPSTNPGSPGTAGTIFPGTKRKCPAWS